MNMRLIALTCAVAAAACNGNGTDTKPAQYAISTTDSPAPAIPATASNADPATANTATATTNAPPTTTGGAASTSSKTTPNDGAYQSATNPAPAAPSVVSNPGSADQTKSADNTKINDRDRHGGALTAMDQGNSGSETKITAAIRKGLMGDKTLSFTAKNVKVITVGTKVTLRGPVKSEQERASIEAIAKQTAGVSEVDDQLEVKK